MVGGYVYSLYCDGKSCKHGEAGKPCFLELMGKNLQQCRQRMKRSGWKFVKALDQVFCPKCAKIHSKTYVKPIDYRVPKIDKTFIRPIRTSPINNTYMPTDSDQ